METAATLEGNDIIDSLIIIEHNDITASPITMEHNNITYIQLHRTTMTSQNLIALELNGITDSS